MLRTIALAAAFSLGGLSPIPHNSPVRTDQAVASTSRVRLKHVRLSTGIQLQIAESGPPDGEPVLFLHGFPDSWFSYSRVLDHLPANVRAIVPSQRGHGESDRPTCCYRIADFAADAVALLDALGIERAHIVGHSMGSIVAQRVASTAPGRVLRLVLIGSGTTGRTPPIVEFNEAAQKLTDPLPPGFAREFQQSTVFKPVPPAFMDTLVLESEKLPARVWRGVMAGLVASDAQNDQTRIRAPTLIIWGDQDALFARAEQDGLLSVMRGARLITYANIGHSPVWEVPARVAADLHAFLKQP